MAKLILSLGSNLGDRRALLDEAVRLIGERVGKVEATSNYVETEPWGFVSTFPFLNACVRVSTTLTPREALVATQQIERELGRTTKSKDGRYSDRPIDIDLLMYDDVHIDEPDLKLPHPLMHERDFVMIPLRDVLV